MQNITVPKNITFIAWALFDGCVQLKTLTIPENVSYIGIAAFRRCENLDVVIENSKENVEIGRDAFDGCKSVTYTK